MMKKLFFTFFLFVATITFSQEKSIEKITTFPNPFTNSTRITFNSIDNSQVIFTVKNILGKTVFTQKINTVSGKNSFPFSKGDLSTGIYIYTIQNKKQITSKRFVIQ